MATFGPGSSPIDDLEWAEMKGWRTGLTAMPRAMSVERPKFRTPDEDRAFDSGFYQGKKDRRNIILSGRRKPTY